MLLRCGRCTVFKPKTEFYEQAKAKRGYQNRCKDCVKQAAREYYAKNREKVIRQTREWQLQNLDKIVRVCARARGLDPDEVEAKLAAHDGLCDICRQPPDPSHKHRHLRLKIDHDHNTPGILRGFLCHGCNIGLGGFKDDPTRLLAAIRYLADNAAKIADAA